MRFNITDLQKEKIILFVSFAAGLVCAVAEFIFSIFTGSQSVLMDALYDSSELVFIIFILFLTPLFHKPVSEKYPYGFYQVETIIVIVKGFMMLAVTVGVSADVIGTALSGGNPVDGKSIALFQTVQAVFSIFILIFMQKFNKSLSSPSVKAEILGWKIDIYYSGGLAIAFFISTFLEMTPLNPIVPYFDQMVVFVIMAYTIPENIILLKDAIKDVFLFPPDDETVETIKAFCEKQLPKYNFTPLFYDITRTGRHIWAAVYFETEDDMLSVAALGAATKKLNAIAEKKVGSCTVELIASSSSPLPQIFEDSEDDDD